MRLAFSKLPPPAKETVGQQAARGTASIHAGYSRPTVELCWWDKGGQIVGLFPGDSGESHLIHFECDDVGRSEPACRLVVPRIPAVPPCNHVERDGGGQIDLMCHFMEDGLPLAEAELPTAATVSMQPGPCGGRLALSFDQAQTSVSGARHASD